jgi:hypothetical protein
MIIFKNFYNLNQFYNFVFTNLKKKKKENNIH